MESRRYIRMFCCGSRNIAEQRVTLRCAPCALCVPCVPPASSGLTTLTTPAITTTAMLLNTPTAPPPCTEPITQTTSTKLTTQTTPNAPTSMTLQRSIADRWNNGLDGGQHAAVYS